MVVQQLIIFTDVDFLDFKKSLDAEMKRLQSKGLGTNKRQAEPKEGYGRWAFLVTTVHRLF